MPSPFQGDQPIGNEDRMRSDRPAEGGRPPPSTWEQITASFRVGRDEIPGHRQGVIGEAYIPIMGQLEGMGWKRDDLAVNPDRKVPGAADFSYSPDKIWTGVETERERARRAGLPDPFPKLPQSRAEFDQSWQGPETARQGRDARTVEQSDTLPWLAGSFAAGFTDPVNLAALPLGGGIGGTGLRALAKYMVREGLINAGTELAEQPLINVERVKQGRPELTVGERLQGVGIAGLVGAGFAGAHVGTVKTAKVAYDSLPLDYRLAQQLKREVPAAMRSPQQQAAINVIERGAEIDASNPGPGTYEGLDAHSARLQDTMDMLDSLPRSVAPQLAPDVPAAPLQPAPTPAPAAPRGPAQGRVGFDNFVYEGLKRRGLPEHVARGVAAGVHAESASNPNVRGGYKGRAVGYGQWLGPRRAELIRRYGPHPTPDQQLDFLVYELNGGDAGGKAVLASTDDVGALDAYIGETRADGSGWGFMRPLHGDQRKGDLNRGMAALGRGGEDMPGDLEAGGAAAPPPLPERPAAMDAAPIAVKLDTGPLTIASFKPGEIGVDAALMQFKAGGDQFGVTDRLRGVQRWDPMSAGMVTVWEALDGRRLIADGHQRLGLAKRMMDADPALDIRLPAYVLREADGVTAAGARVMTALKNLREGSGSAIDAGKVLRETGLDEGLLNSLPQRGREAAVVRDGRALAVLSQDAFGAVINKVIPESHGAAIGALAPDPETHMGLVELLAALDPPNRNQAESIVRQALDAGFAAERQEELFGARDMIASLFLERAKVLDRTLGELRKLRGAFGVAARNAEALDAAGNRIDVGASEAAAQANARALAIVDRLALRKGNAVNAIITRGAERLAAGEPLARVVRDTVAELTELDLDRAILDAGQSGEPAGAGRYDGDAADEAGGPRAGEDPDPADLTPAERDALEAEGQGGFSFSDAAAHKSFDDPAGPGVEQAAASTWHDIEADQARAREAALQADVAAALAKAEVNQAALVDLGQSIKMPGVSFIDNGVKKPDRIAKKVRDEGYASAAELRDVARVAFVVQDPAQVEPLVAAIAARFPGAIDRGWKQLPTNYLDRKQIVQFPNGGYAELQIVPEPVWAAKQARGGALYKQGRKIETDPAVRAALQDESRVLYTEALAGSAFEGIAVRSAAGNRAANSSAESASPSIADLTNSPGASRQVPADQAQARPSLPEASTATGRSSTSNNSSFTESPPLGDNSPLSDLLGESQDAGMLFDLGDGKGARSIADIDAELKAGESGIDAIRGCL